MQTTPCSTCKFQISSEWFFCPNCGKQLKEKVPVITVWKQILIYLVSFFLAPLGLGWGFKYIRSTDLKVRIVGLVAIFLTVVSVILLFYTFKSFADQYGKVLNNLGGGLY
ncbi:MAG: zinc ribbon domain-containing protein [Microgenomates group bacterium]|nr:hypothetical protein [Candidatus Woesebacteria bacterium]MBP6882787.1 hypothetical protein [Candidatus Woesebacteria bacterium]